MFTALGTLATRARWWILAGAAAILAAGVVWGTGVFDVLVGGGIGNDPDSESARAIAQVEATIGRDGADVIVLYSSDVLTVDDPAYADAVAADLADVPAGQVTKTLTWFDTGSPALVSTDRHSTFAVLQLAGSTEAEREATYEAVLPHLQRAPDGFTVQLGGNEAMGYDIGEQVGSDIMFAELLSMPILLVLLVFVFRGLVAASLPLVIGTLAVFGSFAALRLITLFTEVSIFSINVVTMLGLGLAVDYALFIVSRFREEIRIRPDVEGALVQTMRTAGRTVAFSALTVALSLSSLLLFPQVFLRSMAFGGISAVLVAMLGSLTVLPALLAVIGTRIDRWQVPIHRRDRARHRRSGPSYWSRTAHHVMRRPKTYVAVIVPVLILLGLPFLGVNFGAVDHRVLPADTESRVVAERLGAEFPESIPDSVFAVVTLDQPVTDPPGAQLVEEYREALLTVGGVVAVELTGAAGNVAQLSIHSTFDLQSDEGKQQVAELRTIPPPPGGEALIGGRGAELVDLLASLGSILPWMIVWIALTTLVLLFLAFGSVVLPLKAFVMNVLSLGASFGAIVWIFQDGNLSGPLDFTVTGAVDSAQPVLMLAIAFGLSMDYEVFLLSRIREAHDAVGDNKRSVAIGLRQTGGIITSAALLLIIVFAAFGTSGITFIKMIGVGMVLAIVIDATIVRTLLVPASMRLLGEANWWAPRPLARFWQRFGFREAGAEPTGAVFDEDDDGDQLPDWLRESRNRFGSTGSDPLRAPTAQPVTVDVVPAGATEPGPGPLGRHAASDDDLAAVPSH